jgi:hypothetical protein
MSKHESTAKRVRVLGTMAMILGLLAAATTLGQETGRHGQPVAGLASQGQFYAHDFAALANADPVDRQLAEYARRVPDMGILRLYGSEGTDIVRRLPELLGAASSNVDYEHDKSVRETLLELQMQRIAVMIEHQLPSATLFKVGGNSAFDHGFLCVITLDTAPYQLDPAYAGRLMSPSRPLGGLAAQDGELIRNEDFLKFTVDHEVFHCLDAYFGGPTIKKTSTELEGLHQDYVNEARADAFASRAFRQREGNPDSFLRKMAALRTLSVLDLDLPHFTGDVIRRSLDGPAGPIAYNLASRVDASRALVAEVAPDADRYAQHVVSAARLVSRLGGDSDDLLRILAEQPLPKPDESAIASLLDDVRHAEGVLSAAVVASRRRSANRSGYDSTLDPADTLPSANERSERIASQ